MSPRKWRPWEYEMIGEWCERTFPDAPYKTHVHLGRIQPRAPDGTYSEDELKMLGVYRRFADAIVFLPDRLLLVEATMRADPGKLAQLELYELLLPQTPELAEHLDKEVQLVLLYCIHDPVVDTLARRKGIMSILFAPSFFDEWFNTLRGRHRRAPLNTLD